MSKKLNNKIGVSRDAIEKLARCFLPEIRKCYESEEWQQKFREWKIEQEQKTATENSVAVVVIYRSLQENKQTIRTLLQFGKYGSDYIALVRRKGLEPPTY